MMFNTSIQMVQTFQMKFIGSRHRYLLWNNCRRYYNHHQRHNCIQHLSVGTAPIHQNYSNRHNVYLSTRMFSSKNQNDVDVGVGIAADVDVNADISSSSSSSSILTKKERQERTKVLHEMLQTLNINGDEMANALHKSLTTMEGFDPKYGKSAIKTYKTFLHPKPSKVEEIRAQNVVVSASRCARQIDFLIKRHKSHETEWVRHTDEKKTNQNDGKEKRRFPLILLLDNVRSAFNVGSMFRTADACGCSGVFTTGITPSPNGRGREKLAKSALGADTEVPSEHFVTTEKAIHYIRENMKEWTIIGMETTDKSINYTDVKYPGAGSYVVDENESIPKKGVVLVLGNEVTGVDTEIMPSLDLIVEIPMYGSKNSLNIAACAPVVLYEILRQWNVDENKTINK